MYNPEHVPTTEDVEHLAVCEKVPNRLVQVDLALAIDRVVPDHSWQRLWKLPLKLQEHTPAAHVAGFANTRRNVVSG